MVYIMIMLFGLCIISRHDVECWKLFGHLLISMVQTGNRPLSTLCLFYVWVHMWNIVLKIEYVVELKGLVVLVILVYPTKSYFISNVKCYISCYKFTLDMFLLHFEKALNKIINPLEALSNNNFQKSLSLKHQICFEFQ